MQLSMDAVTGAREISARIKVILEQRQASLDSVLIRATKLILIPFVVADGVSGPGDFFPVNSVCSSL